MNDFSIDGDRLVRLEPCYTSEGGTAYTRETTVITKEEFVACYEAWIKENDNGTVITDDQEPEKISLLPMVYESLDDAFRGGYNKGYAMGLLQGSNDRPKGEWVKEGEPWGGFQSWKCCTCGKKFSIDRVYTVMPYNFCPNCGSQMEVQNDGI